MVNSCCFGWFVIWFGIRFIVVFCGCCVCVMCVWLGVCCCVVFGVVNCVCCCVLFWKFGRLVF